MVMKFQDMYLKSYNEGKQQVSSVIERGANTTTIMNDLVNRLNALEDEYKQIQVPTDKESQPKAQLDEFVRALEKLKRNQTIAFVNKC